MIEAFAHFYFGSNFAAQVLIVQVRETTFNYLLIGQTDLQKSVHNFQLKDDGIFWYIFEGIRLGAACFKASIFW